MTEFFVRFRTSISGALLCGADLGAGTVAELATLMFSAPRQRVGV